MSSLCLPALVAFGLQNFAAHAQVPAPIVVNSTFDGQFAGDTNPGDGLCDYDPVTPGEQCTLRAAIQEASALSGARTITFDPAVFATPTTIVVSWESLEPANGTTLTIDGGANKVTIASMFGGHRQFALGTGFAPGANLTLNNISINNGGGIVVGRFCTLTVNNALFAGNSGAPGSGIFNSGTLTVNNSTFSENNAAVVVPGFNGGAIHNGGIATVKNSMFVLNRGHLGGAIFNHPDGTISLGNSYVGLNHAAEGDATFGTITSLGHNAFRVPPDMIGDLTGNFRLIDHLYQYYPLADNGGPTRTHALLATSGLIDKGKGFGPAFDQRGFPRPYDDPTIPNAAGGDGTDIGPYEVQDAISSLVVTKTADTDDGVCDSDCSLREAIMAANSDLGAETISFNIPATDPGCTGGVCTINLLSALPDLSTEITINGPGARLLAVRRNATSRFRIFTVTAGATVSLSGLTVTNGHTEDDMGFHHVIGGGGIQNSGVLTLTGVTVSGNQAGRGQDNDALTNGNGTPGGGGGGIVNNGTLNLIGATVSGNRAGDGGNNLIVTSAGGGNGGNGGGGGGILNSGTLTVTNSTISGNQTGNGGNSVGIGGGGSGGAGGGIGNNGTLTVINSTVSGNQTGAGGSGTSGNGAGGVGGGIINAGGTVNARNSIIAGNAGSTAPDFHGTLTSQGYNLIGSTVSLTIAGDTTGNILNQNALLGPLQNNGGPTPTLHPLPGSPVIDAGDPVFSGAGLTDQRGWPRVSFGRVDIGAVEYAPFAGNSVLFDGVNDFLILSNAGLTLPTNEITVEFWERVETVRDQFSFILFPDVETNRFSFSPLRTVPETYWDFGDLFNGGRVSYGTPSGTINQWTHWTLVSTRAGNAMRIYRNGALDTSSATNRALVRYAAALVLGARLDANGPEYFKGEIDEFRIWSVARTPSEIQTDMNNGFCPPQANLWLYWKFNEPSGATVLDHSGNGRDGLLFNGATRTVSFAPLLPTIANTIPDQGATQDVPFSFTFSADADAGTTFTYSASGVPAWLTFTPATRTFSGTPANADVGFVDITVTATDTGTPSLSVSDVFRLTVAGVNDLPSFTIGPNRTHAFGTVTAQNFADGATAISDGDPEVTQALTFNVSNDNAALFTVQPGLASDGTLTYTPSGTAGTANVSVSLTDDATAGGPALTTAVQTFTITVEDPPPSVIHGRFVFYNQSSFDGNDPAANATDDGALAVDKTPLLPGGVATFANYTSFSRGLNGVMLDVAGLWNAVALNTNDFVFKLGNDNTPAAWGLAPAPASITVRAGAGTNGSDRVTLIWSNNAIQKTWLEITVLATTNTGLATPDVFYFGNAIGESGNSAADAKVTAADSLGVLNHTSASAASTNHYDFNRDGKVGAADRLITLNHQSGLNPLRLIDLSGSSGGMAAKAVRHAPAETAIPLPTRLERQSDGRLRLLIPAEAGAVRVWTALRLDADHWEELTTAAVPGAGAEVIEVFLPLELNQPQRFFRFEPISH